MFLKPGYMLTTNYSDGGLSFLALVVSVVENQKGKVSVTWLDCGVDSVGLYEIEYEKGWLDCEEVAVDVWRVTL